MKEEISSDEDYELTVPEEPKKLEINKLVELLKDKEDLQKEPRNVHYQKVSKCIEEK